MDTGISAEWIFSSLLLSLRIAPAFALAPPFSLTRSPPLFRALLGLGMAAVMAASDSPATRVANLEPGYLVAASVRELGVGLVFVLALQLMFGALYVAGRTLDIQVGFGLAAVLDPSTGSQTPLIGSLLAYAAAAVFFSLNGHADLLRIVAASLQTIPLGAGAALPSVSAVAGYISTVFAVAFGVAGGAILCLFLSDVTIALVSRTVPQMNVLIMGLQVKSLLILAALPMTLGLAGALLARLAAVALEAIPRLL